MLGLETLQIIVTKELANQLRLIADSEGISLPKLDRRALADYVEWKQVR